MKHNSQVKFRALFLVSLFTLSLCACIAPGPQESEPPVSESTAESVAESTAQSEPESEESEESVYAFLEQEFGTEGYRVTIHSYVYEPGRAELRLSLRCTEDEKKGQGLEAKNRFRLRDATKHTSYLTEIYDLEGNSLLGRAIAPGETIELVAIFALPEDFVPVDFHYVYDVQGFREVIIPLN